MTAERCVRIVRHHSRWMEDLPDSSLRWLALPGWLPWRCLIGLRSIAYDRGILPTYPVHVPVVSVGNITAGGTGKTPAVITICAELSRRGRRPAIISRGYRGMGKGHGRNDESQLAGDVPVFCDPNRVAAAAAAMRSGADILIMDDGFQHRRLHRDLDVVLIDATKPWGHGIDRIPATLPLGYLREPISALKRADIVWITRADLVDQDSLSRIKAHIPPDLPIIEERSDSARLVVHGDAEETPIIRGTRCILASGIGNPAAFEALAQRHGLLAVECHRFPDHHPYSVDDLEKLCRAAVTNQCMLVVTGKDAVKLRELPRPHPAPPWAVLSVASRLSDDRPLVAALDTMLRR